jgi:FMN-dependent NADH-azoreductase
MKLLHIDSSITGEGSVSRRLSAAVVDAVLETRPDVQVVRRDLDADPIPHLDSRSVSSLASVDAPVLEGEAARTAALLQEFLDADVVVIGAPMYNFGIPSLLKAWFDRVLVNGKTFRYTANGPEGLAGDKTVIVASARGGIYSEGAPSAAADFQETHLRTLLGFIGVKDVRFVRAEGVAIGPEQRQAALDAALAAAPAAAAGALPALAA